MTNISYEKKIWRNCYSICTTYDQESVNRKNSICLELLHYISRLPIKINVIWCSVLSQFFFLQEITNPNRETTSKESVYYGIHRIAMVLRVRTN